MDPEFSHALVVLEVFPGVFDTVLGDLDQFYALFKVR